MSKTTRSDLLGLLLALSTLRRPTRHDHPSVLTPSSWGCPDSNRVGAMRWVYSPSPSLTVNVPIHPFSQSGRRDSNPRFKAGNLAFFQAELQPHYPLARSRNRTGVCGLWCTKPLFFPFELPRRRTCTAGGTRTPIDGFGDRGPTLDRLPSELFLAQQRKGRGASLARPVGPRHLDVLWVGRA